MTRRIRQRNWGVVPGIFAATALGASADALAADHLDTPTVIADPGADIGDLFAWTSYEGKRLNLVMTIVGHSFSSELQYVFHIDSGKRFGETSATTSIACRMPSATEVDCQLGEVDSARGDASGSAGLQGRKKRFRVFAGLRDDPFFNNVKGTRDAYQVAAAALREGATVDAAGCPRFSAATSQAILEKWRQTDGGPGRNFLNGWTPASLVVSVDLDAVRPGGTMLAVWAATVRGPKQIDRMGRPLTGNALLGTLAEEAVRNNLKEEYNSATPARSAQFIPEIQKGLALYDGFDGTCGNQVLADRSAESPARYRALAALLADDRLWIDSESTLCIQFFAVELAALTSDSMMAVACGGRTPTDDAVDTYRSLLVTGRTTGVDDGVDRDERDHSLSTFPFLAQP